MPVAWDEFEAVDEPKAETDWNEFEPVETKAPADTMPTAPGSPLPPDRIVQYGVPTEKQAAAESMAEKLHPRAQMMSIGGDMVPPPQEQPTPLEDTGKFLRDVALQPVTQSESVIKPAIEHAKGLLEIGKSEYAPAPTRILSGVGKGLISAAESFTSPLGLATLVASVPKALQAAVSSAFGAMGVKGAVEQIAPLQEAIKAKDWGKVAELSTDIVGSGAQAAIGAHGVTEALRPVPEIVAQHAGTLPKSAAAAMAAIEQAKPASTAESAQSLESLKALREQVKARLDEIYQSEHDKVKGTQFEGQSRWSAIQQTVGVLTDLNTKIANAESTGGKSNASEKQQATEVHGDLQPQPQVGPSEMPVKESRRRIQPPAEAQADQVALTASAVLKELPTKPITLETMAQLPVEEAAKLFQAKQTEGADKGFAVFKPSKEGVLTGLKLTEADLPRVQQLLDESKKRSQAAGVGAMKGDPAANAAWMAEGGKTAWLGGVLEGIKRTGRNYDAVLQENAEAGKVDKAKAGEQTAARETSGEAAPGMVVQPPAGTGEGAGPAGDVAPSTGPEKATDVAGGAERAPGGLPVAAGDAIGKDVPVGTAEAATGGAATIGEGKAGVAGKSEVAPEKIHEAISNAFEQAHKSLEAQGWKFDPQFGPLETVLKPEWLGGMMFMGDHPHPTMPGRRLYEYKHGITRKYLRLDDEGQAYSFNGNAKTEVEKYPAMDLDKAIDNVFAGIEKQGETRESKYNETYRRKRDEALINAGIGISRATPEGTLTSVPKEPEAPAAAIEKVQKQVAKAKVEGEQPTPKQIKTGLVSQIESEIEKAKGEFEVVSDALRSKGIKPELNAQKFDSQKSELIRTKKMPTVTIDIPGDGKFTIPKTKEALTEMLDRAKKLNTSSNVSKPIPKTRTDTSHAASTERLRREMRMAEEMYGGTSEAIRTLTKQRAVMESNSQETDRADQLITRLWQEKADVRDRAEREVQYRREVISKAEQTLAKPEPKFGGPLVRKENWKKNRTEAEQTLKVEKPELEAAITKWQALTKEYDEFEKEIDAQKASPPTSTTEGNISEGPGAASPGDVPPVPPAARAANAAAGPEGERPNGVVTPASPFLSRVVQFLQTIGTELRGMAGESAPKTTAANREAGEKLVRYASAKIAARPLAAVFSAHTLEGTGVDPFKLGVALTEDNLRSVRETARQRATELMAEGQPDEAAKAAAEADAVKSMVGAESSPFKTEDEYQDFLADAATQKAIGQHIQQWNEVIDPMYKNAQGIDPEVELPSRGLQTGARINLKAVLPEDENAPTRAVGPGSSPSLTATFRRKSPFGVKAKGTGTSYEGDYPAIMANTFERQLEIANKNAFDNALVEAGLAKIDQPGQRVTIDGQPAVPFPLKRQRVVITGGEQPQGVSQNQNIYVSKKLANEYRRAANVDAPTTLPYVTKFFHGLNKAALAGLTDFSVHTSNLMTALFNRPTSGKLLSDSLLSTLGRADVPVALVRALVKASHDNTAQLASLAEIGAGRGGEQRTGFSGRILQSIDRTTRLVLDDAFHQLAQDGVVPNTETNRREFVNAVGQYNRRLQGPVIRLLRDTGMGPFATAGRTFNTLGVKMATLSPGAKASNNLAALALRANVLSKWVGAATLAGLLNYLLTKDKGGGVMGRPGTPIGKLDTGKNDKAGRPLLLPLFDLIGLGRALRVTGAGAAINAKRYGLTDGDAINSAFRDVANSAIGPAAGPPVRFGMTAATGQAPAVNVPRVSPVAPPGKNQVAVNVTTALEQANPAIGAFFHYQQGKSASEAISSQAPRFTLSPGRPERMMKDYLAIVRRAQANSFIEDVIGRARKMEPEARRAYLREQVKRLENPRDRQKALKEFKFRRVW